MEKKCYQNKNLFDGRTHSLMKDKIVLTDGEKIAAIEDKINQSKFPAYETVDMDGLTMMPGLIDAHVHVTVPSALEKNILRCIIWIKQPLKKPSILILKLLNIAAFSLSE